jgi:hypothetical protein
MSDHHTDLIEIRIEFERGAGDPSRVFHAMAGLIESTQLLDSHLALILGANVRTTLLLQDVEAASLKAKLKTVIEEIPDEAVKDGDVKKVIGHFLFKAKHKILDWCSARDSIQNRDEVKQLEAEIHELAEESDIKLIPAYAPLETATLLTDINSVKDALAYLETHDVATYKSPVGASEYNPALTVSDDVVRELITREIIAAEGERILKVKKPDYLGSSKWGFKYGAHMIEAKVLAGEWLNRFQSSQEVVLPGDSLRVVLREEVSYGYDNEIVHTDYEVVKVLEVIRGLRYVQDSML